MARQMLTLAWVKYIPIDFGSKPCVWTEKKCKNRDYSNENLRSCYCQLLDNTCWLQICLSRGDTQLVLPLVYDVQTNVTQLADKKDSQPHLSAVNMHLKRSVTPPHYSDIIALYCYFIRLYMECYVGFVPNLILEQHLACE